MKKIKRKTFSSLDRSVLCGSGQVVHFKYTSCVAEQHVKRNFGLLFYAGVLTSGPDLGFQDKAKVFVFFFLLLLSKLAYEFLL